MVVLRAICDQAGGVRVKNAGFKLQEGRDILPITGPVYVIMKT